MITSSHDETEQDFTTTTEVVVVRPLDAWIWTGDAIYPPHRDPVTNGKTYREATLEEMKDSLDEMKHYNQSIGYKQFVEGTFKYYYYEHHHQKESLWNSGSQAA